MCQYAPFSLFFAAWSGDARVQSPPRRPRPAGAVEGRLQLAGVGFALGVALGDLDDTLNGPLLVPERTRPPELRWPPLAGAGVEAQLAGAGPLTHLIEHGPDVLTHQPIRLR